MITCTMKMHFSFPFAVSCSLACLLVEMELAPLPDSGQCDRARAHALGARKHLQLRKMFNYLSATTPSNKCSNNNNNNKRPTGKKTLYFLAVVLRESTLQANANTKLTINITCFGLVAAAVHIVWCIHIVNVRSCSIVFFRAVLAISPSACAFKGAVAVELLTT